MEICKQQSEINMQHLPAISTYGCPHNRQIYAIFLGQSIGIDETNTFQLNFYFSMNVVGATVLGGLWAWHPAETKLRCPRSSGIYICTKSELSSFCSFRYLSVQPDGRTDGQG